jgi:hypothetical protein
VAPKNVVKVDVKQTLISGAKDDKKVAKKDDKKVAKKVAKKDDHCVDLKFKKDSQLLPCLFVYSLTQKRERVAH